MPDFAYEAIDTQGQKVHGRDEAESRDALLSELISKGLQPVSIKKLRHVEGILGILSERRDRFNQDDLLYFTKELADLLEAGVPLERALSVIYDSTEKKKAKKIIDAIRDSIHGGKNLSGALSAYPKIFNRLYVNMVTVGELGGVLPQVLKKLDAFLEQSRQIRKFIISSSIYPAILFLVGFLSVFILVTFVVPKFGQIFKDLNQPMPMMTQIIVSTSVFLKSWWWAFFFTFAAILIFLKYYLNTPDGRANWHSFLLRIPLVAPMILKIELARLARTLGTLLESGVPILKGISLAREVVANTVIRNSMDAIYKGVRQGKSLSQLMKKEGLYPSLMIHLVAIGEETGGLDAMLLKIADDFETRIQQDTKVYLSLIEPVTIVVMGLLIGGIIISMLLAIFGLNDVTF
jgi:type II secretion system protein F